MFVLGTRAATGGEYEATHESLLEYAGIDLVPLQFDSSRLLLEEPVEPHQHDSTLLLNRGFVKDYVDPPSHAMIGPGTLQQAR